MYTASKGVAAGLPAGVLPTTGVSIIYTLLTAFVLISVGVAAARLLPKFRRNNV
jgi:uncharacterized protein (DUF2062 family)